MLNNLNEWTISPVSLHHPAVSLLPLSLDHHTGLVEALKDGDMSKYWYTQIPTPENLSHEISRRLDEQSKGNMLPFTVKDNVTGKLVGMTSFTAIDKVNHRLEIGFTWYAHSAQRTHINTLSKLLLLGHAFEKLDAIAVEFRTHSMNFTSQRAILRLGAKLDGVLRSHRCQCDSQGEYVLRDTHVYSILKHEWPTVKVNLNFKLSQYTTVITTSAQ